jgi:Mg-chelatase subunit ChlD
VSIRFDQPALLLLALAIMPLLWVGWRATTGTDALRRVTILGARALLLAVAAVVLARPYTVRDHDQLTVIGLLDVSDSVRRFADVPPDDAGRRSTIDFLRRWIRGATGSRQADDRFGLVVFDGQAVAVAVPTTGDYVDEALDVRLTPGTNIADAVRLGLAMFPADTARRLVLVSDGNETAGDAVEAARRAAGLGAGASTVPIDILPIVYRVRGDVQVLRIEVPPSARPKQTVTVRMVLAATEPTPGRLTLRCEGEAIDLNGAAAGTARDLVVPAGQSVHLAQVELRETPVNRFEALFEPLDPARDRVADNNAAETFTATPSRGKVLVVDPRITQERGAVERILTEAGLPVVVTGPEAVPEDLLSLQSYDLVVLNNVAAFEVTPAQQELLARYVHDLGGGLLMIGGDNGFGAGGWNGSPLEDVLPLELDPPRELRLPSAALVLVLDKSGSMNQPVAGARASQQEVANEGAALAIESLRSESLVGVVTFDTFAYEHVPLQRNDDPARIADRVRGIAADGGTNLAPALRRALSMLRDAEVAKKRVVCLSDGRSSNTNLDPLVEAMTEAGIQLTTIAVGDEADRATLKHLAEIGGGEFYSVRNPRTLPRVLVDSVQVLNKPLIKEVAFVPVVHATGSSLTVGMDEAPVLDGLVVTAPREETTVTIEMSHPDGEPLLAHWQAGLGRAAAFTSDFDGPWSRRWLEWPTAPVFLTQLARMTARPTVSRETELLTEIRDDRLFITLEVTKDQGGFLDYLQVEGTVYRPDGETTPVRLRQTAPGRYETTVEAPAWGNYIVALNPRRGARQLAPAIGGASRTTNPEFRRYESNVALLDRIAQLTRGRRLELDDPTAIDVFDRADMPRSRSSLPAWRPVLWAMLALLLLDVACRRLAWDAALLRSWLARALARVVPARVRGEQAAGTLATLRRVSTDVDRRLDADAEGLEKLEGTGVIQPPPPRPVTPPAPGHAGVGAALDSLLGKVRRKDRHPPPEPEPEPEPDDREAASETTSSLLEAKRRARRRMGKRDDDK